MFDVCVIGHVVWDRISCGDSVCEAQPGGVSWYASLAYRHLGLRTAVVTKVAPGDEHALLGQLRSQGIHVINRPVESSTTFRNHYDSGNADLRTQRMGPWAGRITLREMPRIRARMFHFGPLVQADIDPEIIAQCSAQDARIALDAQGLTRNVVDERVVAKASTNWRADLRHISVLQADTAEMRALTGSSSIADGVGELLDLGIEEVIVTKGSRGSTVFCRDRSIEIDAVPPRRLVDATGCGDTHLATYMATRMMTEDLRECGECAAVAASLKLESRGAFTGTLKDILDRQREMRADQSSAACRDRPGTDWITNAG